ncbi:MAG: xylulokinase, partial [Armatimonadetes bacterium]|nr:xylulokinase [Armatimonadota bacterium]
DGSCATQGAGVGRPGVAYAYLGSTAWIGALSQGVPLDAERRLFVVGHLEPGVYAAFGTAQTVGSAFEWVAREVAVPADQDVPDWAAVEALAAEAEPGCQGLFFLPYMMGERSPVWDSRARGTWVGLTLAHRRSDLVRSVYEGAAFALRSILDAVEDAAGPVEELRLIGGGARSKLWMPLLAAVLGKTLVPCRHLGEATALGAAMAAGVGAGVYGDLAEAADLVALAEPCQPEDRLRERYEELYQRWRQLYPCLRGFFAEYR